MKLIAPFAAVVLLVAASSAGAQTAPPASEDHSAHHPADSAAPAPQAPAPGQMAPGAQGMMGDGMQRMMAMMHSGAMMGGMPMTHVEGRLAFLKTELKITAAQEPQWSKFADAFRAVGRTTKSMEGRMMQGGAGATAPDLLARQERQLTARLDAVRTIKATFDPLYAALSGEQKKVADELMGHMEMM